MRSITRFPSSLPFPFARAVQVGEFLFLSGQLSMSETGEPLPGDIAFQTRTIIENISRTLEACGSDIRSVIKVTVWLSDLKHFLAFNEVYKTYFHDALPARSVVNAKLIFNLDVEIEVQALVLVHKKFSP